ncbi:MAG: 50S ribosomal protein L29 [Nanoarchaeota archaeon]|nr:50S ribosomal protein L29 [Nanoarchaeota archaeon]
MSKKVKELKELGSEGLTKRLEEMKKELMKYRGQISTGTPTENPGQVRNVKRTIARIKTIVKLKKEDKEPKK